MYQETGKQPTHTAWGTDIAAVGKGCGIGTALLVRTEEDVRALRDRVFSKSGLLLAQVKIGSRVHPRVMPPRDGSYLKDRFRGALLGADAFR